MNCTWNETIFNVYAAYQSGTWDGAFGGWVGRSVGITELSGSVERASG